MSGRANGVGRAAALGAGGVLSASAVPALVYAGAPWWAAAPIAALGVAATLALGIVQSIFPQDSCDRRDWWHDLWQHLAQRHAAPGSPNAMTDRSRSTRHPAHVGGPSAAGSLNVPPSTMGDDHDE
jgi:hypothetical protein